MQIKKPQIPFFYYIINVKYFDPINIKKDTKNVIQNYSYLYYIGYVTILNVLNIYSVNPLYLVFNKVNGYFEEINGNKYLTLDPTNESKGKIKNMDSYGVKSRI